LHAYVTDLECLHSVSGINVNRDIGRIGVV